MKQTDLGLELSTRRTRKQILLEEMEQVIPWTELLALITPHAPGINRGQFPIIRDCPLAPPPDPEGCRFPQRFLMDAIGHSR